MGNSDARLRRAAKTRAKIRGQRCERLCVYRSPQHIYAQIIAANGDVVVSASSVEKDLRSEFGGNIAAAEKVGILIGRRGLEKGISKVAFDRSGFKFHGRVKALADKAREAGLEF